MDMPLDDSTPRPVVITGASTGIGRACALRLDRRGYTIFAAVRRSEDADALRTAASSRLVPIFLDITDAGSIRSAADMVAAHAPRGLSGLVNNAGIAVGGPLEFVPIGELRRQIEVNVIGQVAVTQAFLPLLRGAGGRIINIGSVSGRLASPLAGPYAASKFALEAITDALRRELAPWDLHVVMIEAGNVATPIWAKSASRAEETAAALPPQARVLYGDAMAGMMRYAADPPGACSPDAVAQAVERALTARAPRARYLVGRDAQIVLRLVRVLPDRWLDRLFGHRRGSRLGDRPAAPG
jgi:NAD(P)-dependent dehydrogenase (short-subunit alcohol dehydrogenase family)